MRRGAEWALGLAAALLAAAFLSAVAGGGAPAPGTLSGASTAAYFHGGKAGAGPAGDRACGAAGCHAGLPHARDRRYAALRNMHVRFIGCLVCHGKDSPGSWTVLRVAPAKRAELRDGGTPGERWTIAATTTATGRERLHALLGPALSCRACHSAAGSREIAAKGGKGLPGGFEDPVALRMIEEGAKQWIPDTMR